MSVAPYSGFAAMPSSPVTDQRSVRRYRPTPPPGFPSTSVVPSNGTAEIHPPPPLNYQRTSSLAHSSSSPRHGKYDLRIGTLGTKRWSIRPESDASKPSASPLNLGGLVLPDNTQTYQWPNRRRPPIGRPSPTILTRFGSAIWGASTGSIHWWFRPANGTRDNQGLRANWRLGGTCPAAEPQLLAQALASTGVYGPHRQ